MGTSFLLYANTDKYLLKSGNKKNKRGQNQTDIVWESNDVKLGITLENNLKFHKHLSNICSKANRKLSALTRVAKFLSFKKRNFSFHLYSLKLLLSRNVNITNFYHVSNSR